MDSEKKREFATYYRLHLDRQLKSRAKREAVSRKGLYVFLGGDTPDRPYLKVLKSEYLRVWKETAWQLSQQTSGSGGDPDALFNLLRPHIERQVYRQLSVQSAQMAQLDREFQKRQGRALTVLEKEQYARALQQQDSPPQAEKGGHRRMWINSLLDKVRHNQSNQADFLQQIWANLVGSEAAMETQLYKIDAAKGVAYCRSLSSSRNFQLQGQKNLAALLGKALKTNIRKIIFR